MTPFWDLSSLEAVQVIKGTFTKRTDSDVCSFAHAERRGYNGSVYDFYRISIELTL